MLSKSVIQKIKSLHQSKERFLQQLFIAEGVKLVDDLLQSGITFREIFAVDKWIENNDPENYFCKVTVVTDKELERISALKTPNQVVAIAQMPQWPKLDVKNQKGKTLFLDGINDPGNLGTIIRLADWFSFERVVCSSDTADAFNLKTVQSTMGSIARVPVYRTDIFEYFHSLSDKMEVYGAFMEGKPIKDITYPENLILIIGSEAHGIREIAEKFVKQKITIPSPKKNNEKRAESLNASMAAAIIMYEISRS